MQNRNSAQLTRFYLYFFLLLCVTEKKIRRMLENQQVLDAINEQFTFENDIMTVVKS